MCGFCLWPLAASADAQARLPAVVVTAMPALGPDEMPPEIALLLPGAGSGRALLSAAPERLFGRALGLFLSDPFLNVDVAIRQLSAAGVGWVAALPSCVQHEGEFRRYLQEVDLDLDREARVMSALGAAGISTIGAATSGADARHLVQSGVGALLVLPHLGHYLDGPVPLARRLALECEVADALGDVRPALVGLREAGEPEAGLDASLGPPR